jgi:hypothetical protein
VNRRIQPPRTLWAVPPIEARHHHDARLSEFLRGLGGGEDERLAHTLRDKTEAAYHRTA